MSAGNLANLSYAKIGHGDDSRAATLSQTGTGNRSGAINVAVGSDIRLTGGMIGHVNSLSPATTIGGVTQIGVSRDDPSDASGGGLFADASSQFHGEDELRFYLPRRGNNQIAAGAMLNGTLWSGASTDPAPVQRIDEYTIHILGNPNATPNEHGNVFGSGPIPANLAGFAFYYDTIVRGPAPFVSAPPNSGSPQSPGAGQNPGSGSQSESPGSMALDYPSFFPDDRTTDDWQREQEGTYSGPGESTFYYEGFSQYGFLGESTFSYGGEGDAGVDEEEILSRHLRMLGISTDASEGAGE